MPFTPPFNARIIRDLINVFKRCDMYESADELKKWLAVQLAEPAAQCIPPPAPSSDHTADGIKAMMAQVMTELLGPGGGWVTSEKLLARIRELKASENRIKKLTECIQQVLLLPGDLPS